MDADDFLERLAAPTPAPGGGAAAARVGSFAGALLRMVAGLTLRKAQGGAQKKLEEVSARAEELSRELQRLEAEDARAFERYLEARRAARAQGGPGAASQREAARGAAEVSLALIERSLEIVRSIEAILDLEPDLRIAARSDLFAALDLAEAAARIAHRNALENCAELGPEAEAVRERAQALVRSFEGARDRTAARE